MLDLDVTQLSPYEQIALLPEARQRAAIDRITKESPYGILALKYDWRIRARPKQLPPPGDWSCWVARAGRGFGKTRTGAEWLQERAEQDPGRWMAIIAKTPADARDYMIEGPGGLLRNTPPWKAPPVYEVSKRRVTWQNGSWATVFSAEEPEQLRGFSGDTAWLDEFGKWKNPDECWRHLGYGMREASSDQPRTLITTTPRPLKILKMIEALPSTVVVTGSSYENRGNLAAEWFRDVIEVREGTHDARQEIHGEILDEVPGAIVTRAMIEEGRVGERQVPPIVRTVVAVDPAMTNKPSSDETGIVCVALGNDGEAYVLSDVSGRLPPAEWARRTVRLHRTRQGDRVIAERNQGGDLVEQNVRLEDPNVPYTAAHVWESKPARAEPVLALYERRLVHHVGSFPELEDQVVSFTPVAYEGIDSPDRADALILALTELMIGPLPPSTDEVVYDYEEEGGFVL